MGYELRVRPYLSKARLRVVLSIGLIVDLIESGIVLKKGGSYNTPVKPSFPYNLSCLLTQVKYLHN